MYGGVQQWWWPRPVFEGAPANPHPQSPHAAGAEGVAGEVEPRPPRGRAKNTR